MAEISENQRGGATYDDDAVRGAYLAHRHSDVRSPNIVMEEPAFLDELGDVSGKRILDLGCGDGSFAEVVLGAAGASYVGIDGSAKMVAKARERLAGSPAQFEHADIEDFAAPSDSYDVVASRMALHYVDEIDPVFSRAHAALSPGGRLLFSVVHPVITSHDNQSDGPRTDWTVDNYFVTGPRDRKWFGASVTWYHRTIEQYIGALTRNGFNLASLRECAPEEKLFDGHLNELERRRRVPLILLISAAPR